MTFAIRAIWVVSPFDCSPLYERFFNTVETRAKKSGNYVPLPDSNSFVEKLLIETGVKKSELFVESRDGCNRQCCAPAFELETSVGFVGPVVVLQHKGLLLCGLPLTNSDIHCNQSYLHEVAQTMDCLDMISQILKGDILLQKSALRTQITRFISIAFPFGHPICLNASLSEQLLSIGVKESTSDKIKQPIWNPSISKGNKTQVSFHISEQVHYQGSEKIQVSGTLWLTVGDLVDGCPEMSVMLTHPQKLSCMTLAPRVQTSVQSDNATTLAFSPSPYSRIALCHYITACDIVPLKVQLIIIPTKIDMESNVKLIVHPTKAPIQSLEVTLCRANLKTRSLKFSVGTAVDESTCLRWDIPTSKIKSKPAELEATLKLTDTDSECFKCYAQVSFKISDQAWSGCKIVPQSVSISPSSKIKTSFNAETSSGYYTISS